MTKRDNDKLNNLYMEAVQPPLKAQSGTVYVIIDEVPYEGQRTLGIYTTSEAAQQALAEYVEGAYGDLAGDDLSIKPLALNQPASFRYSD
jgi:hypothetical protein